MDMPADLQPSAWLVWGKRIAMAALLLLVVYGIGLGLKSLFSSHAVQKKAVTNIRVLPDTPPPPPPPKEPPKEQPKEQPKEIKVEQPKPQETPQPPAEALKMEGAAGNGPSPFAAGTVTNEYKGGEVNRIGGKKGMAAYAWYTGQIKTKIEQALADEKQLAKVQYRLVVYVWFARSGRVERAELQDSTGNREIDEVIKKSLAAMAPMSEAPPDDMPQPVKLRITSKNVG
jgi:outer membrane biosynthesis protein TonB